MSKIVLVTGGSSGLGRCICQHLNQKGYRVYGTSRKAHNGQMLDNFQLLKLDVADRNTIDQAMEFLIAKEGRIDVLVNNAGISTAGPIEEQDMQEAKRVFETNVWGVMNMCQAILPQMRSQGGGQIINTSSIAGSMGLPFRSVYSASKHCVEAFTESLSMEVARFNIKVSVLQPGDFNTELNQNRTESKLTEQSVYKEVFDQQMQIVSEHMDEAMDPKILGDILQTIIEDPKPKLRYMVGPFLQKFSTVLKRVLPARTFEGILKDHYKLL